MEKSGTGDDFYGKKKERKKEETEKKGESARMKRKKRRTSIKDWEKYSNDMKILLSYKEIYLIPGFKILILIEVYAHV